jgi:DNA-binding response OmpR family regulator
MTSVLLAEDDPSISDPLARALRREGYDVDVSADGPGTLGRALGGGIDLIVLDLGLPELDGLEVCRRLRSEGRATPVLVLTARVDEVDTVIGLDAGADDYVTKPFSPRELVLRVESVLRRGVPTDPPVVLKVGPLTVDTAARRACKGDTELNLTVRELDLLAYLMAHPGTAFTRTQLMSAVWGWTFGDQSTVTVHVRRVREKIEDDPRNPQLIQTVWGVGYRMESP